LGVSRIDHATPLYLQMVAVTSPTSGGRSIGIVCSRTKATELVISLNQMELASLNYSQEFLQVLTKPLWISEVTKLT
jgi:hypothetical protein